MNVLGVFFREPTEMQFIKGISRKIGLAHTSVMKYIKELEAEELILKKKGRPFDGYVANRDSEKFKFYKQVYNLNSLFEVREEIVDKIGPKTIILFGSYQGGEDIEGSDVDILVVSKIRKDLDLKKIEKKIERNIHLTFVEKIENLDENIQKNVRNGWVLYGNI